MKIGELSKATTTKVTTIRFYEQIGLLETPARTASGRRTYGISDVDRRGNPLAACARRAT
jgi:DNA-binding transcriptional MerR regulator